MILRGARYHSGAGIAVGFERDRRRWSNTIFRNAPPTRWHCAEVVGLADEQYPLWTAHPACTYRQARAIAPGWLMHRLFLARRSIFVFAFDRRALLLHLL